jgi:hypothetical protein
MRDITRQLPLSAFCSSVYANASCAKAQRYRTGSGVVGVGTETTRGARHSDRRGKLHHVYALRFHLGLGAGGGIGAGVGMSTEWWGEDWLGFGGYAASFGYSRLFQGGGSASGLGATAAVRTRNHGNYGMLQLGAGFGSYRTTYSPEGLCLADDCPPDEVSEGGTALFGATAGWMFHPGVGELGPLLRLDAASGGVTVVTINIALGVAVGS